MREEIETLQQYSRSNNLEITGIPEKANENVITIIKAVAECVGVTLDTTEIDAAHRVRSFLKGDKPIIVKFVSRLKKSELVLAVRAKKGIFTEDLYMGFPNKRIYINGHLTPVNKQLWKLVRESCQAQGYKYYWVRDGRIFVRKGDNDHVLAITSHDMIAKIR